jgi:hypothetical protein
MSGAVSLTFNGGVSYAVCACCNTHSDLPLLANTLVFCRDCGHQCSCQGCVAETDGQWAKGGES